ncbi:MAG TPA: histidinol dehydrogenase [Polyangiaceae bacterium]|jgi:histidinol dehydrogenase|nr:histidinol dehydrogenase [Polyangiaceae bacterium]
MTSIALIAHGEPDFSGRVAQLRATLHGGQVTAARDQAAPDVTGAVRDILAQVAAEGDEAAARLTSKFDRANITKETLRVPAAVMQAAHSKADPELLALMRRAITNIRSYQSHILHKAPPPLVQGGRTLGVRYTPIDRVGCYVPGGKALYPSTVLMTVVPAQVAGVREIVMSSPPSGGEINPMALALAYELGITEVYRMGGAVGVAAMAYGTPSIAPVQKIVGPGNAYVAEAKRQLFGKVGIDAIAGPSEVLIVADDSANAAWVAADLLAQAEHDPGSALLVTPSRQLAEQVARELESQLAQLERAEAIAAALSRYCALIVVADLPAACALANEFATEHLQIITRDNATCLQAIRHAGAIFLGTHTPVPLGDYYAGPSHVLPTGGTAKFFGPLSCNDFLKASSLIEYDAASLKQDARDVIDFATREGLTAHANAVRIRGR